MHDPAIFNFRPSCLVRMSRDDIIDQYQINPIKIGEGNDAVVYKAKQNFNGGQWRAVKKIHRSYIDKEEYLLTEIEILKRLDHPGILKIFQVFDDSQYVSIVTELCEGNSLLQQLKKRSHYSQLQAKQIFLKLLEVVSYCHQNKIIHRDLKLENLVYCTQKPSPDSLRLIDFGMAFEWKSNPRQEIKNTFESNKIVGTIYYMAPQIRNQTYDHRVDIWSCGVILFTLLTGQLPFNQEEDEDIIEAIKERKICYQKLIKRKCSNQVIDLLKRIFVNQSKRISIQEIFNHFWLKKTQDQEKFPKNEIKYFSLVPYRQFIHLQQFRQYYHQKIQQIAKNDKIQSKYINHSESQKNNTDYLSINWNNFYQFLALDQIEKAIKIYLTYRLTQQKSNRYRKIFDHFKTIKKENILLLTLHDSLYKQYQHFLNELDQYNHSQNIILSQYQHHHHKKRQLSIKQDQHIYSVKKVYEKILTFLQQNKYRTVGYTMFISWICDYQDINKEQLDFLRNNLRNKSYEDRDQRRDVINQQITNIHKIIRKIYLQKKAITKSQFSYPTSSLNSTATSQRNHRNIPLLSINVDKIKDQQKVSTKRTSKKSIKQNILQSISPTFIKRNNTVHKNSNNGVKTQRPANGNRLLQNINKESGFMMNIHKIISFL